MARTLSKRKLLIAVVDDDHSVRVALSRLVRSFDMDVETFASGSEFLRQAHAPRPDCLVLDLWMPELNGLEVQSRIARLGWALPIVFTSASTDNSEQISALNAGATAFLRKPFNDEDLLRAIISATGSQPAPAPAQAAPRTRGLRRQHRA